MKRRKIYNLLIITLITAALSSCSDEIYGGGKNGAGGVVTLKLSYTRSVPTEVVSTRSDATASEQRLSNLQIFVFDYDTGKLIGYKWLDEDDLEQATDATGDGTYSPGTVAIKARGGSDCYIYGVANVNPSGSTNSEYSISSGVIPTTADEAKADEWDEAQVAEGLSDFTLDKLKSIAFERNCGIELSSPILMSGVMNDGNKCHIGDNGTLTLYDKDGNVITDDDASVIKLRRVVSKITVNVKPGTGTKSDSHGNPIYTAADGTTVYRNDDGLGNYTYYTDEAYTTQYTGDTSTLTTTQTEITFKPTSCEICYIPVKGVLIEGTDPIPIADNEYKTSDAYFYYDSTSDTENTYTFTNYYLPENVELEPTKGVIKTWSDREKDNGDGTTTDYTTNKSFATAPQNGTYLKITGNFTETLNTVITRATPVYYIHLGDFGADLHDFKVERNCNYTYDITVTGVASIKAEVKKETGDQSNGAVEGIAITLQDNSKIFDLDSHYGQINMKFTQDCVVKDDTKGEYYVYFFSKDIRETTPVLKLSKTTYGSELAVKEQGTDSEGNVVWNDVSDSYKKKIEESIDWLKFVDGTGNDGQGAAYPGSESTDLKSFFDIASELIDLKIKNINSSSGGETSWDESYTCFVNENYYDNMQWSDFANTEPRYAYICKDLMSSFDLRSISGAVIYGITQRSIQAIYNTDKADEINAYGVETDPDDISDLRSSNAFKYTSTSSDRPSVSGKYSLQEANGDSQRIDVSDCDSWNGRANFVKRLNAGSVTTWAKLTHDHFSSARYSCMSRNRDNNGDGTIDDDEIRWYPPTLAQYRGLYLGEYALDTNARLFKGSTSDIEDGSGYGSDNYLYRLAPAYHYWSCIDTNVNNDFMFWSEGSGTSETRPYGRNEGTDHAPWGVACVRNLPKNGGTDVSTEPDKYYSLEGRTVNLENMSNNTVRKTTIDGELPQHAERGSTSYINKPAVNFIVAKSNTTDTSSSEVATTTDKTICADYYEESDGSDKGKWRAPNFMELGLISIIFSNDMKNGSDYINCRTHYSNTTFRCSWCIDLSNNHITASHWDKVRPRSVWGMYMRCVRDAMK